MGMFSRLNEWFTGQVEEGNGYQLEKIGYHNPDDHAYHQEMHELAERRHSQYPYDAETDQYDMTDEQAEVFWDEWSEIAQKYEDAETAKPGWKRFFGL